MINMPSVPRANAVIPHPEQKCIAVGLSAPRVRTKQRKSPPREASSRFTLEN